MDSLVRRAFLLIFVDHSMQLSPGSLLRYAAAVLGCHECAGILNDGVEARQLQGRSLPAVIHIAPPFHLNSSIVLVMERFCRIRMDRAAVRE